ncbi:hypothetical protein VaNZ11_003602 [Volvox africanus]|uniref:SGNH hydrolase-type esterase domain-containing protein n=1 Tax=Volvox africanus TaxID=51714 RepID=A0ABQ5RW24_9CHLO|nr:hypothetical protein VaNZ11_003602 [Volvox africanus]
MTSLISLPLFSILLGLSTADKHTAPITQNLTEAEVEYANIYWIYNATERIMPTAQGPSVIDSYPKLDYRFSLPSAERMAGITYVGHASRLRMVLERARHGETLRIGALGGSITSGHGVGGGEFTYLQYFMDWLNGAMPAHRRPPSSGGNDAVAAEAALRTGRALRAGGGVGGGWLERRRRRVLLRNKAAKHEFLNGAVPGTMSGYTSSCLTHHLIPGADLVFVEFAVNDSPLNTWADEGSPRRPLERLFRKLLNLPSRPAVVLVNMFAMGPSHGNYHHTAERDFMEFATYYSLPAVSLKAAVLPSAAVAGAAAVSLGAIFNGGLNHPGRGGHVVITELLITLCLDLLQLNTIQMGATLAARGAPGEGSSSATVAATDSGSSGGPLAMEKLAAVAARPLPHPIFPGNYGATQDTCYIEHQLQALTQPPVEGWEWTDEGRGKWGYVAMAPGKTLRLKVNTQVKPEGSDGALFEPIIVQISYLQSYRILGTAKLSCKSGCACEAMTLNAYDPRPVSVAITSDIKVTQHPECCLQLITGKAAKARAVNASTVRGFSSGWEGTTPTGSFAYKFKLIGLVVGEDPRATEGTVSFVRGNTADIFKKVQALRGASAG